MTGPEIAAVTLALSVAGGALSAVQSIRQGQAANEAAKFNARVLQQRAERERQLAEREAQDTRRRGSRAQAQLRARLAGAGVSNFGTALLLQQDLASEAELQARRIQVEGNNRSLRLRQNASLEQFDGRTRREQGFLSAGTSILRTARSIAGSLDTPGTSSFEGGSSLGGQGSFAVVQDHLTPPPLNLPAATSGSSSFTFKPISPS